MEEGNTIDFSTGGGLPFFFFFFFFYRRGWMGRKFFREDDFTISAPYWVRYSFDIERIYIYVFGRKGRNWQEKKV